MAKVYALVFLLICCVFCACSGNNTASNPAREDMLNIDTIAALDEEPAFNPEELLASLSQKMEEGNAESLSFALEHAIAQIRGLADAGDKECAATCAAQISQFVEDNLKVLEQIGVEETIRQSVSELAKELAPNTEVVNAYASTSVNAGSVEESTGEIAPDSLNPANPE